MQEARIVSQSVHRGAPHLTTRPAADEHAPYYARYVDRVPGGDIVRTLEEGARETDALLRSERAHALAEHRYAEGKWSVKEVLGHLTDAERVFAYRMMRIARADATPLPGFDENAYTPAGRFDERALDDLLEEFLAVRHATIRLVRGLPAEAWTRRGTASDNPVSVRALAYIIAGHELHHRAILEQRYFAA
ncbi:MAG TPA: DinB family protein [Longimicrobiales bacterium]